MIYRIAADTVVLLHLGFILFALLGGWLVVRRQSLIGLHLPALCWGVWIELSHRICPLTPLENRLRVLAGEGGYEGGFIEHYLIPLIYPPGLSPHDQLRIALALLAINMMAYVVVLRRGCQRRHRFTDQ